MLVRLPSTTAAAALGLALCAPATLFGATRATAPQAAAQQTGAQQTAGQNQPPAQPAAAADDPDSRLNPAQPDFTIAALPTTLRVPRHKSAFRVTHRFGRPLGQGDFGDLVDDFFGFDSGAQIGLEYRYGLFRGTQVGIYRTSNRAIQLFAQHDIVSQQDGHPLGIAVIGSVEGTNNFRDDYSPAIGAIVSHELGERGAVYVEPIWIHNSNVDPAAVDDDPGTLLLGLGGRLRVRPTLYVLVEASPRLAGFAPATTQVSVGLEKRAGGHAFQINFSNGLGTTLAQLARGGTGADDWYIGFNISRKFF